MPTFVMRNGKLVDKAKAGPRHVAHGRAAFVITDEIPPTKHMATGQVLTSKRAMSAATRAAGCVEVGTDPAGQRPGQIPMPTKAETVPYVQRAIAQLESR
jgi:hypothetical protein